MTTKYKHPKLKGQTFQVKKSYYAVVRKYPSTAVLAALDVLPGNYAIVRKSVSQLGLRRLLLVYVEIGETNILKTKDLPCCTAAAVQWHMRESIFLLYEPTSCKNSFCLDDCVVNLLLL